MSAAHGGAVASSWLSSGAVDGIVQDGQRFAARLLGSRSEDPLQGTLYFRDSLVGSSGNLFPGAFSL